MLIYFQDIQKYIYIGPIFQGALEVETTYIYIYKHFYTFIFKTI